MSVFGDAFGFIKGVGESGWDAMKDMMTGGTHLAKDGYALVTDNRVEFGDQ